jgi:hypothetical protein
VAIRRDQTRTRWRGLSLRLGELTGLQPETNPRCNEGGRRRAWRQGRWVRGFNLERDVSVSFQEAVDMVHQLEGREKVLYKGLARACVDYKRAGLLAGVMAGTKHSVHDWLV